VGVPLSRFTGVPPPEGVAVMLVIWTLKEMTLAMGASVPTTKAGPVEVEDPLEFAVETREPLPQPAATNAAAVSERSASRVR
jgi:hypothetical protein